MGHRLLYQNKKPLKPTVPPPKKKKNYAKETLFR